MEHLITAWAWTIEHWDDVVAAVVAMYAVASLVVALTPSPKDDELLAAVRRFVVRLSFLAPSDHHRTLSLPGRLDQAGDDRADPEDTDP